MISDSAVKTDIKNDIKIQGALYNQTEFHKIKEKEKIGPYISK
jgi:hypothetical protein